MTGPACRPRPLLSLIHVLEWRAAVHPGAIALISIGCGADANPSSGVTGAKSEIGANVSPHTVSEITPGR